MIDDVESLGCESNCHLNALSFYKAKRNEGLLYNKNRSEKADATFPIPMCPFQRIADDGFSR